MTEWHKQSPYDPHKPLNLSVQWIQRQHHTTQVPEQRIAYGITPTPYGEALWGFTSAGLCHVSLHDKCTDPLNELQIRWPGQDIHNNQPQAEALLAAVLQPTTQPITLWMTGTAFQIHVWQALIQVPAGETVSYQQLAKQIGKPQAARAVGSALGKNPIAWLIPCHRVVRQTGDIGQYHWGSARKAAMLQAEQRSSHYVGGANSSPST